MNLSNKQYAKAVRFVFKWADRVGGRRDTKPERPRWLSKADLMEVITDLIEHLEGEIEIDQEIEDAWDGDFLRGLEPGSEGGPL